MSILDGGKDNSAWYAIRQIGLSDVSNRGFVGYRQEYGECRVLPRTPEERRILNEQHRLEIAKRYGVPISYVMLDDELANWRATRAIAKPQSQGSRAAGRSSRHSGLKGLLRKLRLHAKAGVNAYLQIVAAIYLLWAGRS